MTRDEKIAAEIKTAGDEVARLTSTMRELSQVARQAEATAHAQMYDAIADQLALAALETRVAHEWMADGDPEDWNQ